MKLKRIIIYPQDVQRITGRSERYGRKLLQQIRFELGKEDHQFITYQEFARYTGIPEEEVEEFID